MRGNAPLNGQWIDKYQLLEVLAADGVSEIFRGREAGASRDVAIKALSAAHALDPEAVARFRNEVTLVQQLAHPHILPIEHVGQDGSRLFLVTPLLKASLRDALAYDGNGRPLNTIDAIEIATQISLALSAIHTRGWVHCALKPENILLSETSAVLTEFGSARRIESERYGDRRWPRSAQSAMRPAVGASYYMAPEQFSGQPLDPRADLYALGAVLFEMLTGRPPNLGGAPSAGASRTPGDGIAPPSALNASLPPGLDAVIMRVLARDPQDRYPSAEQFRVALQRFGSRPPGNPSSQVERFGATGASAARMRQPQPPKSSAARNAGGGATQSSSSFHRAALPPMTVRHAASASVTEAATVRSEAWGMVHIPPRSLGVTRSHQRVSPDQSLADRRESARYNPNNPPPPARYGPRDVGERQFASFSAPAPAASSGAGRRVNRFGPLIALAAILFVVSGFAILSLIQSAGSNHGAASQDLRAATTPTDVTNGGLAPTATTDPSAPTVTPGPHTPTLTPRPASPTPSPGLTPTATPAPNTPTPTQPPTPTATPAPTATPTDTPTPIPTDTPTP
jgi:serine/threonine-protein kinase